jgi:hypothetical protein
VKWLNKRAKSGTQIFYEGASCATHGTKQSGCVPYFEYMAHILGKNHYFLCGTAECYFVPCVAQNRNEFHFAWVLRFSS